MQRRSTAVLLASALAAAPLLATVEWHGALTLDGTAIDSESASFLGGGFGRFGADGDGGEASWSGTLSGDLNLRWTPTSGVAFVASGVARVEDDDFGGDAIGITGLFLDLSRAVGERSEVGGRLGVFFPATSFENVEPGWHSPYTLTLSAINSWVGEDVRDVGFEARWSIVGDAGRFTLAGAALGGNDASGTLLAWRGFALHDRLTVVGETVGLTPLATLADTGIFGVQRDSGTQPIGDDLDGRIGWSARAAWRSDRSGWSARVRVADNRGDREFHRDQYAWRTRTINAGLGWNGGRGWTVALELLAGDTGMGVTPHFVDVDFAAQYLLISRRLGDWRLSGRFDRFETRDRDGSVGEISDEDGHALTVAVLRQEGAWRFGVELVSLDVDRPDGTGFPETGDGETLRLEIRRSW